MNGSLGVDGLLEGDSAVGELRERLVHAREVRDAGTPATTIEYCVDCDRITSIGLDDYPDFHPDSCWENDHTSLLEGPEEVGVTAWIQCVDHLCARGFISESARDDTTPTMEGYRECSVVDCGYLTTIGQMFCDDCLEELNE